MTVFRWVWKAYRTFLFSDRNAQRWQIRSRRPRFRQGKFLNNFFLIVQNLLHLDIVITSSITIGQGLPAMAR